MKRDDGPHATQSIATYSEYVDGLVCGEVTYDLPPATGESNEASRLRAATNTADVRRRRCVPSMAPLRQSIVQKRASCSTTCASSIVHLKTVCCEALWTE
uniref:Uncharacterized protein n=1 Tax=Haptolina brevifila TaxID=156173 RepID=A0A7S2IKH5_9EUKA